MISGERSVARNGTPVVMVSVITNQRVNYPLGVDCSDVGPVGDIHSFVGGNGQTFGMSQTSIFRRSFITALTIVPRYASLTVPDNLRHLTCHLRGDPTELHTGSLLMLGSCTGSRDRTLRIWCFSGSDTYK